MRTLAPPERVRFVLVCSNPWNTLTSLAAWRALDPPRRGSVQVVVVPHPVTGQAISNAVLSEMLDIFAVAPDASTRLADFPRAGAWALALAVGGSLLPRREVDTVWISPQEPKSYVIRELASAGLSAVRSSGIVLSDDGLSFNKSLKTRRAHYWKTGRRTLALVRPALQVAKDVLASRLLLADARLSPHMSSLSGTQGEVLRQLRHALRPGPGCQTVGDAWFLSQPFEQDSNIPKGQYYGFLERQLGAWERQGIDVRVKLHPREVQGRADWIPETVLEKALPADLSERPIELLLRHKRPRALVGISSTSLLTAALIGDIPTFSIPPQSMGGVELRWQRAAILDTNKVLRDLQLAPDRLADALARTAQARQPG